MVTLTLYVQLVMTLIAAIRESVNLKLYLGTLHTMTFLFLLWHYIDFQRLAMDAMIYGMIIPFLLYLSSQVQVAYLVSN